MPPESASSNAAAAFDAPAPAAVRALRDLREDGYSLLKNVVDADLVRQIEGDLARRFENTPFCQGYFYGERTKRFGGVLKRSAHAEAFVRHPLILEVATAVLGPFCDRLQLNLTQALQIFPGQRAQPPHKDEDMWGGQKGEMEYLINVMWPFGPYRRENGATVLYPGSQIGGAGAREPVYAEMDPGDVLLFLGSTLHGGGANTTAQTRTGMIVSYSLGWLKPYENQWLVYPPEVARTFSPELARLVGYQQHRPNLGNYEGRCPSVLLGETRQDYLGAVEELLPHQQQALQLRAAAETSAELGAAA
jgi:ectoine hydroxylase-related dioxygenase (phytanoyl-CoA dioxygenase family)